MSLSKAERNRRYRQQKKSVSSSTIPSDKIAHEFPSQQDYDHLLNKLRARDFAWEALSDDERRRFHAYDYGLRRARQDDYSTSYPRDPQGRWFHPLLAGMAEDFYRKTRPEHRAGVIRTPEEIAKVRATLHAAGIDSPEDRMNELSAGRPPAAPGTEFRSLGEILEPIVGKVRSTNDQDGPTPPRRTAGRQFWPLSPKGCCNRDGFTVGGEYAPLLPMWTQDAPLREDETPQYDR